MWVEIQKVKKFPNLLVLAGAQLVLAGAQPVPACAACAQPTCAVFGGCHFLHELFTKSVRSGSKYQKSENLELWMFGNPKI